MKKVLFATTALVLSAGVAAAEVKLSGSANMGVKYNEGGLSYAAKDAAGWYEIDIDVVGTTETDSGLTFGASVDLDSDYENALKKTAQTAIDGEVFVSGAFGKFTIGNVDPIADDYGLNDIGLDGIGVDDVAETSWYTSSADARWDYSVGAVTVGVSMNTIKEDFDVGAAYNAGAFSAALTYSHEEATSNDAVALTLGASMDAFSGQIFVTDSDAADTSWGVYGAYKTGALTLEAAYADADTVADEAYGIGAKYDLGGATLAGGLGSVGGNTVADMGVSFKF